MIPETWVLLVEDNPGDARLVQEQLSAVAGQRFRIEHVDHLASALERLQGAELPDVILLDLELPDSQGFNTYKALKDSADRLPVVMLTGHDDQDLAARVVREGAQDYLLKSEMTGPMLARTIRHALERKSAEHALRKSEERFRILFEYAPVAYYLRDMQGRFLGGNRATEELTGYKRNQLVGKTIVEAGLLPESQISNAARLLAQTQLGYGTGPQDLTLIRQDGSSVDVEIRTIPIELDGQYLVLGIARDVTKVVAAQRALRESEERYRQVVEHAVNGIYRSSLDGQFLSVNSALVEILGYDSPDELLAVDITRDIYARSAERKQQIKRFRESGRVTGLESRWKRRDGS